MENHKGVQSPVNVIENMSNKCCIKKIFKQTIAKESPIHPVFVETYSSEIMTCKIPSTQWEQL
jgi:hypothetical protein